MGVARWGRHGKGGEGMVKVAHWERPSGNSVVGILVGQFYCNKMLGWFLT